MMPTPSTATASNTSVEQLVTREMRVDLRKLENAIPIGMVRVAGGWRIGDVFLSRERASWLTAGKLARVVYGRNVRLKISQAGRRAIGAYE